MTIAAWAPIETVPKDGTVVDLWVISWSADHDAFEGNRVTQCYWEHMPPRWRRCHETNGEAYLLEMKMPWNVKPTHWMPIPGAPK